ncbi:MAG: hypothetical protein DHS20C21_08400 [Gemmatimonadota bacterium]|nr:MAG: hypothetical protein DHS20C21_08400 [Gemmatimonadota bacterium]
MSQPSDTSARADAGTSRQAAGQRLRSRTALALAAAVALLLVGLSFGRADWRWMPVALIAAWGLQRWLTRRDRRRAAIRRQPFPAEWEKVLRDEVALFSALDEGEKQRFREELQIFIAEKRITGIQTDVDETTRVLAAASAVIPIFGFPEWEWDQISEILIYPSMFDDSFEMGSGDAQRTLGMVGTGSMNRMMILSKPALHHGFRDTRDRRNVGVHEFAHLIDKSDGVIDGIPGVGLQQQAIGPWVELMRRKMAEIAGGKSDIDAYALTNDAEFFAVVTEYFFEKPGRMKRQHPQLYAMLAGVFRQDMLSRVGDMVAGRSRPKLGRNSPCPCGSGRKFKKCCLDRN